MLRCYPVRFRLVGCLKHILRLEMVLFFIAILAQLNQNTTKPCCYCNYTTTLENMMPAPVNGMKHPQTSSVGIKSQSHCKQSSCICRSTCKPCCQTKPNASKAESNDTALGHTVAASRCLGAISEGYLLLGKCLFLDPPQVV